MFHYSLSLWQPLSFIIYLMGKIISVKTAIGEEFLCSDKSDWRPYSSEVHDAFQAKTEVPASWSEANGIVLTQDGNTVLWSGVQIAMIFVTPF